MELIKNRYVQLAIALIIGITIGALFYPTSEIIETTEKRVQEKYEEQITKINEEHTKSSKVLTDTIDSMEQSHKEYEEEVSKSKSSYEQTISNLKSKITEKTYKLIKPDGTIIEKSFKQSETEEYNSYVKSVTEEFNRKVKSIENRWQSIHQKRVAEVKEESDKKNREEYNQKLEKHMEELTSKTTRTNIKKYNMELGYTSSKKVYVHSSYNLWGPVLVGAHVDSRTDATNMSAGLGLGISF
jgi:uncharacterized membrane-anchored protein YhcB (DUF1043 family)